MRFTHPGYLLLLVPVVVGLVASWRQVHGMARSRKQLAFSLRFLLASALVIALAGPEMRRPNEGICTIFLLDRSDSVSEADRRQADTFVNGALGQLRENDLGGVIVFGRNAVVDANVAGRRSLGTISSRVDGSGSDVAGAVRLASASFPDGKARRVVLLTDGNETTGDLEGAAQVAATDGITLDVVPLGLKPRDGEANVVSLEVPNDVRADQPFELRAQVDATGEQGGSLDIDLDGVLLKRIPARLTPGRNTLVTTVQLKDVGFHRFRATLRADRDVDNRNNVGLGFTSVRGRPRVLVLQEHPERATLAAALRRSGITIDVGGPGSVPSRPEELQRYDAILLNDINAAGFTNDQMKLLQSSVRDSGVGLAMVGGMDSFLPGGWYGTPIAEALPVDLNIRQRKSFPSTSICIVIDTSGSMSMIEDGQPKLRLAAQAAEQTVKLMSPLDRVGVAGSSNGVEFVAPMQVLTNKGDVISQIRRLAVDGGGIYIEPSVRRADEELRKETSKVRHFILLADGNDSTQEGDSVERVARMRADKITTSVVAIGEGKDVPLLRRLAAAGGGRFYLAKKASQLPAIFTQDTSLMSRSAIEEGAFIPKLLPGEDILRGVADDGVPPLLGYCLTDSRPLARVGMRTHKDDPLLATWQYGLGTTLAFTSDAEPRWAQQWAGWAGFAPFWAQATRAISRRATLNRYQVAMRNDGGKGEVVVSAFDSLGNPLTATDAAVRISDPRGNSREVNLSQTAPGQYRGSFDASQIGTYIATVAEKAADGRSRTSATGFSVAYPAEYQTYRANRPLLQRVAETTGGRELRSPQEALRPASDPGASIQELWSLFVLVAALLLPLDVAVRRLALPLGEIFARVVARARRRPAPAASHEVVVSRLQQAKQRAHATGTPVTPAATSGPTPERPSTKPSSPPQSSPPPSAPGSTAQGLLEKKRQRGQ